LADMSWHTSECAVVADVSAQMSQWHKYLAGIGNGVSVTFVTKNSGASHKVL